MRYGEGDRESENVEDRRGEGGGGMSPGGGGPSLPIGGGGPSITSLIVIGVICLMFGINPLELLSSGDGIPRMPDIHRPSQGSRPPLQVPSGKQAGGPPPGARRTHFLRRV